MKTTKELRDQLSKLHDEIAMLDMPTEQHEDALDNVCGYICKALSVMDAII